MAGPRPMSLAPAGRLGAQGLTPPLPPGPRPCWGHGDTPPRVSKSSQGARAWRSGQAGGSPLGPSVSDSGASGRSDSHRCVPRRGGGMAGPAWGPRAAAQHSPAPGCQPPALRGDPSQDARAHCSESRPQHGPCALHPRGLRLPLLGGPCPPRGARPACQAHLPQLPQDTPAWPGAAPVSKSQVPATTTTSSSGSTVCRPPPAQPRPPLHRHASGGVYVGRRAGREPRGCGEDRGVGGGGWAPTTRVWCGRRGRVLGEGTDWLGPVAGRLARPRYSQVTG